MAFVPNTCIDKILMIAAFCHSKCLTFSGIKHWLFLLRFWWLFSPLAHVPCFSFNLLPQGFCPPKKSGPHHHVAPSRHVTQDFFRSTLSQWRSAFACQSSKTHAGLTPFLPTPNPIGEQRCFPDFNGLDRHHLSSAAQTCTMHLGNGGRG